jgi:SAM-dependent methyltransferase
MSKFNVPHLKDTGERLFPDYIQPSDKIALKLQTHSKRRYHFASQFCAKKRVLDVACGSGWGSRFLTDNGAAAVVGVDSSEPVVAFATARYGTNSTRFHHSDMEVFASEPFDIIVCFESLEHVKNPAGALRNLIGLLQPEGIILLSASVLPTMDFYPFHRHEFTHDYLHRLCAHFGLKPISELTVEDKFEPRDIRRSFLMHLPPINLKHAFRDPIRWLSNAASVFLWRGLEYSNLTLACQRYSSTAAEKGEEL